MKVHVGGEHKTTSSVVAALFVLPPLQHGEGNYRRSITVKIT